MSEEQQNGQQQGEDLAEHVYDPPEEFASQANIQDPDIWDKAAEDYEGFWEQQAEALARRIAKLGFTCTITPQTQPVSI